MNGNKLIYRSECIKSKNPTFKEFEVNQGRLQSFDSDILASLYEYHEDGRIKFKRDNDITYKTYGRTKFKPCDFFGKKFGDELELSDKVKLHIFNAKEYPASFHHYTEYLQNGLKLNFHIVVDFGSQSKVDHDDSGEKMYIRALESIAQCVNIGVNFVVAKFILLYQFCIKVKEK